MAGTTNCGPGGGGDESCCASLEVPGGTFNRQYPAAPATVSGFRLDEYLVTVGRFRQFVNAWNGGYWPEAGSGKHAYLNGGQGLVNADAEGGAAYESGWDATDWNNTTVLDPTSTNLGMCSPYSTWTESPGSQENLPISCVNWYEAYAFCIWDGGFLPSEAEWEYAAMGGSEQLQYPWGSTQPGMACPGAGCEYAIYLCDYPSGSNSCTGVANIAPVGTASLGTARWGQLDMAGELWEWTLDVYSNDEEPCTDCASLTTLLGSRRACYGGEFDYGAAYLTTRGDCIAISRTAMGFRCARAP